jgi:phosphoribosylaminoimidazole (AIR) synthetase
MLRTFNMGIGLILVVAEADADGVMQALSDAGEPGAKRIGAIGAGHASTGQGGPVRYS